MRCGRWSCLASPEGGQRRANADGRCCLALSVAEVTTIEDTIRMSALHEARVQARSRALVLSNGELSSNDRSVGKLLDFFGVSWETTTIREIVVNGPPGRLDSAYCLLVSAP